MNREAIVEGLLFIAGEDGLTLSEVQRVLDTSSEIVRDVLKTLKEKYKAENSGIMLEILGEKYKLVTKKEHKEYYEKYFEADTDKTLSTAALEVLAIIAYNHPVTRSQVDEIRGVSSSHQIRRLLSKNLIEIKERSELPGRPNLYGVTSTFLDYFGLSSLEELPAIEEETESETETNLYTTKYKEEVEILDEINE